MTTELIRHLWQSTFFALAVGLLTLAFRKNRASVRYWLWLSASLKFLVPFAPLLNLGRYVETWMPAARQIATPIVSYAIEQFSGPFFPDNLSAPAPVPDTVHWMPIAIVGIWLCGFAAVALVRFRNWLRIRAAVRRSSATGIPAAVEVRVSPGLLEPGVVGLIRPVFLLPEGIAERLTPSELKAVLAHEFCHIRRRDNLFAAIHMMVEAIFWFLPLVWWIGARLVDERERACDEEVLRQGYQPDVYADAILNICKFYIESPLACVSGVSGASVRQRIETIMSNRKLQGVNRAKKLLLTAAGVAAVAGPIVIGLLIGVGNIPEIHAQAPVAAPPPPIRPEQAQTPPPPAAPVPPAARPKFDVVSVRRCMPGEELTGPPGGRGGGGGGRGPRYSPGRLRMQCVALDDMISTAYLGLFGNGLLNGPRADTKWLRNAPAWVDSDWYTIDAETDDPAANERTGREQQKRMEQMLQSVLEERFQLKIHRDADQVPMYKLTVAKGGLKLKPMEAGACTPYSEGMPNSSVAPDGKPWCSRGRGSTNGPNWVEDDTGITLREFAAGLLSHRLDHHVIDETGIAGLFSFHLEYARDESAPGPPLAPGVPAPVFPVSDIPPGPSIFTALEGLGLKLEPTKGPQGYMVIDHIERPSEN